MKDMQARRLVHNLKEAGYKSCRWLKIGEEYSVVIGNIPLESYDAALRVVEGLLAEKKILKIDPKTKAVSTNRELFNKQLQIRSIQNLLREISKLLPENTADRLTSESLELTEALLKKALRDAKEILREGTIIDRV